MSKRSCFFFTVVNQTETAYRERLGMNRLLLEPGLRWNVPFIHKIHRVDLRVPCGD